MLHYREPSKSVKRVIAAMTLATLSLLTLAACSSDGGDDEVDRRLAESFLRNSPTFRFDGLPESVDLRVRTDGECETCVVYTFGFDSSHPGYGDRNRSPPRLCGDTARGSHIHRKWPCHVRAYRQHLERDYSESDRPDSHGRRRDERPRLRAPRLPFELHIGQEAVFGDEGLKITFVDVSEDSRCPAATNCVVSGLAKVRVDVVAGERPLGMHEFVLDQHAVGGEAQGIGQYVFSMRELNPYPGTDTTPYAAIFVVSKVVAA